MSSYRLVDPERLEDGDIRPYRQRHVDDEAEVHVHRASVNQSASVELASFDLMAVGPYLLHLVAEEKAQAVISSAQSAAHEIRERASRQGVEEGREEARQEVLSTLVAFRDAAQALIVFEQEMVSRSTPWVVRLALEIAEKMIGRAQQENPDIIASVLERAKREVIDAKRIRVWLNPADHILLADSRPDLIQSGAVSGRQVEVVASEEVSRGGCRLETEMGFVDATIPTQLDEIRRQLLDDGMP